MSTYASPQAYREAAVLTASPEQLVVMLYDGVARFLRQAELALEEGQLVQMNQRIGRAEAIIDELHATLNKDAGEISERLEAIYVFCRKLLVEARIERDGHKIREVIRLFAPLREAWATIAGEA
jgi:flagellar secretion chaperone FliS